VKRMMFFSQLLVLTSGGVLQAQRAQAASILNSTPPTSSDIQSTSKQMPPRSDNAPKATRLVEVEEGVKSEVLDWGGVGRPVILLT